MSTEPSKLTASTQTNPPAYIPNHEKTQKIAPPPVIASVEPASLPNTVANSARQTANTTAKPTSSVANPASVSANSFSNKRGEGRKDLSGYRTSPKDRPESYVGKRRAREDSQPSPTVYLAIETVEGLGDSVIGASLEYEGALALVQKFVKLLGVEEVFADNYASHTLSGQRLRTADGKLSPYKIFPVVLDR